MAYLLVDIDFAIYSNCVLKLVTPLWHSTKCISAPEAVHTLEVKKLFQNFRLRFAELT